MALLSSISSFNHQMRQSHKLVQCHLHTRSMANLHRIIIATIEVASQNTLKRRLICRARGQPLVHPPLAISTYLQLTTLLIINACKHSKITWKKYNKTSSELRRFWASSKAATLLPFNEIIVMLQSTKVASNRLCNVVTQMQEVQILNTALQIIFLNQLHFRQIQTLWSTKTV